jgi:uncharacterized membrane protein
MHQAMTALSLWLHSLATVILIGHYLLLRLVYLPAMNPSNGPLLGEISRRSRPWLYASLAIFIVSGTYATLVDPNYLGFANFGNTWSIMMLAKHGLILAMLGLGFWFNAILRVGPLMSSNSGADLAFSRFRACATWMSVLGVLVLLLTALSQAL